MVLIKEFRIPLPMSIEEFNVGNWYKIYHIHHASRVPFLVRFLAPKGSLEIHEESWNTFPYCKTVFTNPGYMKENFMITIESFYKPGNGEENNVFELSAEVLSKVEVIPIDIAHDPVVEQGKDPKTFRSPTWKNEVDSVMTCYKLVTIEFKWFGLQMKVEDFIFKTVKQSILNFQRQVFCSLDAWHGLDINEIRAIDEDNRLERFLNVHSTIKEFQAIKKELQNQAEVQRRYKETRYLAEQKMIQETHDEASLRAANALPEGDETDDSGEEEDVLVPNIHIQGLENNFYLGY